MKLLTPSMDNVYAYRLGLLAAAAGDPARKDVGDAIDRGLILLSMLNAAGFTVCAEPDKLNVAISGVIAQHTK